MEDVKLRNKLSERKAPIFTNRYIRPLPETSENQDEQEVNDLVWNWWMIFNFCNWRQYLYG
jgi:hypothetical protein